MKTRLWGSILAVLALAGVVVAGPDMPPPATIAAVATNDTANYSGSTVTNPVFTTAWVDAIVVDWTDGGGANGQTATVSVVTQGGTGSGPSRAVLTVTAAGCSDTTYYPRATAVSTAGAELTTLIGERIPLVQDKIVVSAYDKQNTNDTAVTVRVITSPTP